MTAGYLTRLRRAREYTSNGLPASDGSKTSSNSSGPWTTYVSRVRSSVGQLSGSPWACLSWGMEAGRLRLFDQSLDIQTPGPATVLAHLKSEDCDACTREVGKVRYRRLTGLGGQRGLERSHRGKGHFRD